MRRYPITEPTPLMKVSRLLATDERRCGVVDVEAGDMAGRMRREVAEGLGDPQQPWISPTYLYDARGSMLYEAITTLPEYYPTRTEATLLAAIACDLAALSAPQEVVELGSGSSTKTEQILAAVGARVRPLTYLPIDVSPTMLESSAARLGATYPKLRVLGLSGTYEDGFRALPPAMDRLFVFLGGTIGNFPPAYQETFFERLGAVMQPGNQLLLGFDRRAHAGKPAEVIRRAYDDERGMTAEFDLNMLAHLNRELDADFDTSLWAHQAVYNEAEHRIEMYLTSLADQVVSVPSLGRSYDFPVGSRILTEISRKFDPDELASWFEARGYGVVRQWTDERDYYGLMLLERARR